MEFQGFDKIRNHMISASCEIAKAYSESADGFTIQQAGEIYGILNRTQRRLEKDINWLTTQPHTEASVYGR